MAAVAYFRKLGETETEISYRYGIDRDRMDSELILDKVTLLSPEGSPTVDRTGRKAAGKIISLYRESSVWPEGGGSFS